MVSESFKTSILVTSLKILKKLMAPLSPTVTSHKIRELMSFEPEISLQLLITSIPSKSQNLYTQNVSTKFYSLLFLSFVKVPSFKVILDFHILLDN